MHTMMERRARDDGGAAAVEFALVVPILLVLVFGIINFGFVFAQQIALNNGVRQGARYAVVDGRTCDQIVSETRGSAATVGMNQAQVPTPVISPACSGAVKPCAGTPSGTNVTVTLSRSAAWVIPVFPFTASNAPTLSSVGVMRCEFS